VARLVAIGNFDGVHRGHQSLVRSVVQEAKALGVQPTLLTFDPHPSQVLGRGKMPTLTNTAYKVALLSELEPTIEVRVEQFTRELAALSPEAFALQWLSQKLDARCVIVGENFRFGAGRAGTLAGLRELGATLGFDAHALPLVMDAEEVISSSRIRSLLSAGDMQAAARLLGRPHTTFGTVVSGDALGRTLGFPTANLAAIEEVVPPFGIYACRVWIERDAGGSRFEVPEARSKAWLAAVASIGVRPTIEQTQVALRVEVHLLDYTGDLYGSTLAVQWLAKLRDEEKFGSLEALTAQIARDVEHARSVLG
jgi:riboflavin kinase / FMN adenylyltransferase